MSSNVVVPVDGSTQSTAALETALELFPNATITLLYVADPVDVDDDTAASREWRTDQKAAATRYFEGVTSQVDAEGRTLETALETGSPWREIVTFAEENDVDHVVMGSHGRDGAARLLLGSVAELVVRRSPVPVTVVK
ncbi:universal stress protein [Natrononativus amylolyticus]|uniref:universal stress protein n=1 Tax=Natrononativus amylolyticus TaxID=2963434 RepID=UPI0020CCC0E5|nr:universal stress protein [Natrononativus amylolyticus]